jgi:hypothetical protein
VSQRKRAPKCARIVAWRSVYEKRAIRVVAVRDYGWRLLRLDTSKLPPNQNLLNKDGDFPVAWAKMYGQGRVFYGSFAHDAKTWDNPDVYHIYYEALRWALKLTDADATPRPFPGGAK